MESIYGPDIGDLEGELREEAVKQFRIEIEKVLDLGIHPIQCTCGSNSLFDVDRRKLYLVDFVDWKRSPSSELDHFYELIRQENINFW